MFKINGEEWRVVLVPPFHPQLQRDNGSYVLGSCNDYTKTIYINDELEWKKLKKVLCHEVTHAAMFSYNVKLSYEQEEVVADLIATYGQEIITMTNRVFVRIVQNRGN